MTNILFGESSAVALQRPSKMAYERNLSPNFVVAKQAINNQTHTFAYIRE